MMSLKYWDSEGLFVELSQSEDDKFIHMDVSRKHPTTVVDETGDYEMSNVRYIASCQFVSIEHAQAIAHLLVGIVIQEDKAAWKRGPRGEAYPTDSAGKRIVPSDFGGEVPPIRRCTHDNTTYVGEHTWCDDCGAEVSFS